MSYLALDSWLISGDINFSLQKEVLNSCYEALNSTIPLVLRAVEKLGDNPIHIITLLEKAKLYISKYARVIRS
ncbi:hypothetical protein GF327_08260 [Candidatus Woesearchaeota archaeon]|nr:hypothetical protein [Candidatus Woesearchaeota archaeon]